MAAASPGLGHNLPKVASPVEIVELLSESERDLLARRDELAAGVRRFIENNSEIYDDETMRHAGDFVKQLQAQLRIVRDRFTPAKQPFLQGGRAVDSFFRAITDPLERDIDRVRDPMTRYSIRQVEAERQARLALAEQAQAEARRKQRDLVTAQGTVEQAITAAQVAEQATRAAGVSAADLSRQRGELGSVSSLREVWDVELEDLAVVPLEFHLFNRELALQAVAAGRAVPGVRAIRRQEIVVR